MKKLVKNYWYIIMIIVCFLLMYFISYSYNGSDFEKKLIEEDLKLNGEIVSNSKDENISCYVDIKGEVINPGVYEVDIESRIIDVINIAGGLTKNADTSILNLSRKVVDEMNIKIYSKQEVKKAKESIEKEPEVIEIIKEIEKECVCPDKNEICDSKNDAAIEDESNINTDIQINDVEEENNSKKLININTATKEELMNIPNIGESKADSIIKYREKNKFIKIEDILNVSGIGVSVFDKIKDYITI